MSECLFDTNIVIDMLHDRPMAWVEYGRASRAWISRMTWIETMSGVVTEAAAETEDFLRFFAMCEIDEGIARRAASLRNRRRSLKSPDAIIMASAQSIGCVLVTRNTKDFPAHTPGVFVPYEL